MLKCQISLDSFVWELAEPLVAQGKSLYEKAAVQDLDTVGKGVWTAIVQEQGHNMEIALLMKNRTIQKIDCECEANKDGNVCQHLVASLFALAEKHPKKQLRNQSIRDTPLSKQRISDFIPLIPEERLVDMLGKLAKKNRRLSLIIKATAMPYTRQEPEKYKLLFFLIVKFAVKKDKLSVSGMVFINEAINSILTELNWLLLQGETGEIRQFLAEILDVWPYLAKFDIPEGKDIELPISNSLKLLEKSLEIIKSPETLSEIALMLSKNVVKWIEYYPKTSTKLLDLMHSIAETSDIQTQCFSLFKEVFSKKIPFGQISKILEISIKWGGDVAYLASVMRDDWAEETCLAYCQMAVEGAHFELVRALVARLRERDLNRETIGLLLDYDLLIARSSGDEHKLLFLAERNFKNTGRTKYFKILKELHGASWSEEAQRLIGYFEQKKQIKPLALLLVDLKDWDALYHLAEAQDDLVFMTKVDTYLFQHKKLAMKALYLNKLMTYFDSHLGGRPVQLIEFVLNHLEGIDQSDFAKEIKSWMKSRYGHRPILKSIFLARSM